MPESNTLAALFVDTFNLKSSFSFLGRRTTDAWEHDAWRVSIYSPLGRTSCAYNMGVAFKQRKPDIVEIVENLIDSTLTFLTGKYEDFIVDCGYEDDKRSRAIWRSIGKAHTQMQKLCGDDMDDILFSSDCEPFVLRLRTELSDIDNLSGRKREELVRRCLSVSAVLSSENDAEASLGAELLLETIRCSSSETVLSVYDRNGFADKIKTGSEVSNILSALDEASELSSLAADAKKRIKRAL